MPGPGPHMLYTLGAGQAVAAISGGRFSPHHCIVYTINAFFGPDLGSFSEWLSSVFNAGSALASFMENHIHHPFYYPLILGLPLSFLYSSLSKLAIRRGFLNSVSGVSLTRKQCLMLITAGSLSHFFLDHLFEENGHSHMYTWILSTGWWEGRAPINPDAVVVVAFLCITLIFGFIYINRVKPTKSFKKQTKESFILILIIAGLYALWCASQIFLMKPSRPAVGEEADLGVIVFMAIYFFVPHWLCVMSMNTKDYLDSIGQVPP